MTAESVTPTVTYAGPGRAAGTYEVSGIVAAVIENGGVCTFRLSLADRTVERAQSGIADATSTSCGTVVLQAGDLAPGTWAVTLVYSRGAHRGTSVETQLEIR